MSKKRKIGIGICGVADAISLAGMHYSSLESKKMVVDILSFINYTSKISSIELASQRGSALAMNMKNGNRYYDEYDYVTTLYANNTESSSVGSDDWIKMAEFIKRTGLLRNTTTIALPPTGRSACIYGASTGIEPHFSIENANLLVKKSLARKIGRILGINVDENSLLDHISDERVSPLLDSSTSIQPSDHLSMLASLQKYTDESISKTINMPYGSTVEDVESVFLSAYEAGVSGVTIYVDGTLDYQPITLDRKV
jgi:ribonucleoside-diphosphate reductase alpha chain